MNYYLLVGTYTKGKSEGLYVYKMNTQTGEVVAVGNAKAANPSISIYRPMKSLCMLLTKMPVIRAAFRFLRLTKTPARLKYIDKQTSGGDHPCYVAVNKTGKWVAAANYSGGSFSTLPIMANGTLGTATTVQHTGSSVDKEPAGKTACAFYRFSPDDKYLFVSDLGIDKVMIYSFNPGSGKPEPAPCAFHRHHARQRTAAFTFHPNGKLAYLVEEMGGAVSAYKYKDGKLTLIQRISTYPADFTGKKWSADIHISPDGKFLYATNRSPSNTVAIFSIDKSGKLTAKGHESTKGNVPRNFTIDPTGNFLLVANQDTDDIVIFKRDKKTGKLTDTGKRIQVGNPTCLRWAKEN